MLEIKRFICLNLIARIAASIVQERNGQEIKAKKDFFCSSRCAYIYASRNIRKSGSESIHWKGGKPYKRPNGSIAATSKVYKALKSGKLTKKPCEICGNTNSQAHHRDYTKPLEVNWLCKLHHNMADRDMIPGM